MQVAMTKQEARAAIFAPVAIQTEYEVLIEQ